jgi:CrcB protein
MRKIALILGGGFCGTLARYLLSPPLRALAAPLLPWSQSGFPYDVLAINLSGAFLMGLLYGLVERGMALAPEVRLTLGTGFLGAYTTFSTFVYGGDHLVLVGADVPGLVYLGSSIVLGVGCARLGDIVAGVLVMPGHLRRRERARLSGWWRGALGAYALGRREPPLFDPDPSADPAYLDVAPRRLAGRRFPATAPHDARRSDEPGVPAQEEVH